jgi:hypothetical protein
MYFLNVYFTRDMRQSSVSVRIACDGVEHTLWLDKDGDHALLQVLPCFLFFFCFQN